MKMSEKQFEIAEFLLIKRHAGRGIEAAKLHLVDGISQTEAAISCEISRQRVFTSTNRIIDSYLNALEIKKIFDNSEERGTNLTEAERFDIAMLASSAKKQSKGIKAARLILVDGVSKSDAALLCDTHKTSSYLAIERVKESFEKALELKKLFKLM